MSPDSMPRRFGTVTDAGAEHESLRRRSERTRSHCVGGQDRGQHLAVASLSWREIRGLRARFESLPFHYGFNEAAA